MAPHRHPVRVAVLLAAALLAVCMTMAPAGASAKKRAAASGGVAKVSKARALGGNRCAARRLSRLERRKRVTTKRLRASVRRRCGRRVAAPAGPPQSLYWGATIGSHLTGDQAPWDMGAVASFESGAGKSASMIQFFQPFANCGSGKCSFYTFPTTPLDDIRAHGAIPVLSWSSQAIPSTLDQPDFQLSDVIEGRYDEYIRGFASAARDWGHPFFLRFNWEMNGDWFPWAEGVNGNRPGEYVAAWRHVHDIFAAVGADNVSWVWCPFVDPAGKLQDVAALYPGDEYVDWTGLDGYNWGTNPASPRGWRSFDQLFGSTYARIAGAIAPAKPMMIAEVGSSELGGSKAEWIADALARVPVDYRQVRALLWFDKFDDNMDWPIETSAAATSAFAAGISPGHYLPASFAALTGGSISPPS